MESAVEVVAVVGPPELERQRHARRLALATDRDFVVAGELGGDPIAEAVDLLCWRRAVVGTVVDFPADVDVMELIGAVDDADSMSLTGVVCVLDVARLFDDLDRDDYRSHGDDLVAFALLVARQVEYASEVVLVNWVESSNAELATVTALIGHLGPQARVRLHGDAPTVTAASYHARGEVRPGWVQLLNDDFTPARTDVRVGALRYEQHRPLHPARLAGLLDGIESGRFGRVIRSAGFCRLASRPNVVAQWDHVGRMMSLTPLAIDGALPEGEELLSLGQELAFVGIDLDSASLVAAVDGAALTDAEWMAGPTSWRAFADPFPPWPMSSALPD